VTLHGHVIGGTSLINPRKPQSNLELAHVGLTVDTLEILSWTGSSATHVLAYQAINSATNLGKL
jgi:hypothetical protein